MRAKALALAGQREGLIEKLPLCWQKRSRLHSPEAQPDGTRLEAEASGSPTAAGPEQCLHHGAAGRRRPSSWYCRSGCRLVECAPLLVRGGAVWQLVGLITRRSQVQILPPLPTKSIR